MQHIMVKDSAIQFYSRGSKLSYVANYVHLYGFKLKSFQLLQQNVMIKYYFGVLHKIYGIIMILS